MQNGLDHETQKALVGARPATPEETVIDNWSLDQLTDFCDRNGIKYPIGAVGDELMDAIEASGVPYPVDTATAEEITEPGEVARQLLLAQMEIIVQTSKWASKGCGEDVDDWNYIADKHIRKDAQDSPVGNGDGKERDHPPLYRMVCALSESMALCTRAYAELEKSLQGTSAVDMIGQIAAKLLPALGA